MKDETDFEQIPTIKPGDVVFRRIRKAHISLKTGPRKAQRFLKEITTQTPFLEMVLLLVILWLLFSAGVYFAERGAEGSTITSYGRALYWGIAAFSTAGIADTPQSSVAETLGAIWIVVGSIIFFGAIVATVTTYLMRPLQRPSQKIVDTIEYNLERLQDLSTEEMQLLKKTTDMLIDHMVRLKDEQQAS